MHRLDLGNRKKIDSCNDRDMDIYGQPIFSPLDFFFHS